MFQRHLAYRTWCFYSASNFSGRIFFYASTSSASCLSRTALFHLFFFFYHPCIGDSWRVIVARQTVILNSQQFLLASFVVTLSFFPSFPYLRTLTNDYSASVSCLRRFLCQVGDCYSKRYFPAIACLPANSLSLSLSLSLSFSLSLFLSLSLPLRLFLRVCIL